MGSSELSLPVDAGGASVAGDIRRELARELHDRVAQTLTTMLIELENYKTEQTGRQSALRQLDNLQDSTRDVLKNLRTVLYELRGEDDVSDSLIESVRSLLARFEERTQVSTLLSVAPSWPRRVRSSAGLNVYRIIEEALTNVRLHSGARLVQVALGPTRGGKIEVQVTDDGRGGASESATAQPGLGVMGMRERAILLGGRLEVESEDGHGTTIRAILPREQLI